jgi:tRNA A-37 threonylcarbamoyl transferase component Bud32
MRPKYMTFHRGAVWGVCIPGLEPHLDFFCGAFEEWLTGQPTRVFLGRPNRVIGLQLPPMIRIPEFISDRTAGLPVVMKQFGWRSAIHKLARPLTGSKAIRSFRIAMTLREAGVATPRPLIAWDRKGRRTVLESYYITEEIPDAITLRQILKSPGVFETEKSALLTELARLVRGMHDAGVLHRDLTIGNFLVAPKPVDGNRIFIIDLSRSVHLGRVPLLIRFMDLARMKLGDLWPDFFAAYCTGRPNWKAQRPILNFLIRLRRWKMAFWKNLKTERG